MKKQAINIITLGCSKNIVDSEKLSGQLSFGGAEVVFNSEDFKAKTVIINTCGFILDAKEESIETILKYTDAKKRGLINEVYVIGCLSERYREELKKEIKDIDRIYGVGDIREIVESFGIRYKKDQSSERLNSSPGHYAYLKISEGCDRNCSFCAIPIIKGKHVSSPLENLITEANYLAETGVRELILIAQDLNYYGIDIYKTGKLPELIKKLSEIKKLDWIRLHYLYPSSFSDKLIRIVKESPNICKYLDIPFQHINENLLKRMRRGINRKETLRLIDNIRKEIPGLAIRSTLMVGFPGESTKEYLELKQFVQDIQFERLGVFTYSHEEDTYAYDKYIDDIPEQEKQDRAAEIMEIQEQISYRNNQDMIGRELRVIIDRREGEYIVGRTEHDSPEIDNEVLIKKGPINTEPGNFCYVKIESAESFDLFGRIL